MVAASSLLISVPVFFQAPLVRTFPLASLVLTGGWLACATKLNENERTAPWGDLLVGFAWTWLAGSIYWGWFRGQPYWHLPIEAIGLPFALWGLKHQKGKIGHCFYIGSLLGTAITDLYFYLVHLIPHWRQIMRGSPDQAADVVHEALAQMQTSWGYGCAGALVGILLLLGCVSLISTQLHWRAFGGAVLSTLLVDGLFWIAATLA